MIATVLALLVSAAQAAPLDDYVCMRLNVTETQVMDPKGTGIFILADPRPDASHVQPAASIVFVRKPAERVNGYLAAMSLTGQPGWIAADKVVPFDPNMRCMPSEWNGH